MCASWSASASRRPKPFSANALTRTIEKLAPAELGW
jgi:hypothetical protein